MNALMLLGGIMEKTSGAIPIKGVDDAVEYYGKFIKVAAVVLDGISKKAADHNMNYIAQGLEYKYLPRHGDGWFGDRWAVEVLEEAAPYGGPQLKNLRKACPDRSY